MRSAAAIAGAIQYIVSHLAFTMHRTLDPYSLRRAGRDQAVQRHAGRNSDRSLSRSPTERFEWALLAAIASANLIQQGY